MGLPTGQIKLLGVLVVALTAAIAAILALKLPDRAPLSAREIATRTLAEHLRKTIKPRSIVVISNPYTEMKGRRGEAHAFQKASEAGLRAGFGSDVTIKVAFPKLRPEALQDVTSVFVDPGSTTPLSYLVAENAFDDLIREHPQTDVFVSLIGLPANIAARPYWFQNPSVRFAFLLPDFKVLGMGDIVRHAFKSGKIAGAVLPKSGVTLENQINGDYRSEFERRFILVTPENIDQLAPQLLR